LGKLAGDHRRVEVSGWFAFLLGSFVRPFLPMVYPDRRVRGFNFTSQPQQGSRNEDWSRYFNRDGEVRKVHLPQLACRIEESSRSACTRRLGRVYDRIFIDEVQDLCGYDLEVLKLLMASSVPIEMVGDIRQAILATNERERKNKKYMYMGIWDWFKKEAKAGRLAITQRSESWRCRPEILAVADSLFAPSWGFDPSTSRNDRTTGHDGVFLVAGKDVNAYMETFNPMPLRYNTNSGKELAYLGFTNFGKAKGLGRERVLIFPTEKIKGFFTSGTMLDPQLAAHLYVGVTRAEQSVAIVMDSAGGCVFPFWNPTLSP
jgi:superfamily I DNA/RNA helicase